MSMITATTWVPRGFAAPFPSKYVFDEDEYDRISKLAKLQLDDAKEDLEEAQEEEKQKKTAGTTETSGTNGAASNAPDTEYAHQVAIPNCSANMPAERSTMTSKSTTLSTMTTTTRRGMGIQWLFSGT